MKKSYSTLLFDADLTLFDFDNAETMAFGIAMERYGIQYTDAEIMRYKSINAELWEQFNRGKITQEQLQGARFTRLLATLDERYRSIDGCQLNSAYLDALGECPQLLDGAEELCRKLCSRYELYIATNGVSRVQHSRFNASAIRKYFKGIFVSEDAGAQKPMKRYFDYIFERLGEDKRASSVIIGDSLTTDIPGGFAAGIDTIWYNPTHKPNSSEVKPTYEVTSFRELETILL